MSKVLDVTDIVQYYPAFQAILHFQITILKPVMSVRKLRVLKGFMAFKSQIRLPMRVQVLEAEGWRVRLIESDKHRRLKCKQGGMYFSLQLLSGVS